jgi:hypothetical protein
MDDIVWGPNQLDVIRRLLGCNERLERMGPRQSFAVDLRDRLRTDLEARLEGVASRFSPDRPLTLTKFDLTSTLKCEGLWLAEQAKPFEWTAQKLRGRVVHRAIQATLARSGREAPPLDLVEQALDLARSDDTHIADYLDGCSQVEVAELVTASADALVKFLADWPPLLPNMVPRIESSANIRLFDGRIELRGRYDLSLGMPGRNPPEVLIVDLKTGGQRAEHGEEVCYYALLETLKQGAPPYRVATYYLDESSFREFDVNEDLLLSAARRTVDGVARLADLWLRSRDPALTPGRQCWYCPALPSCDEGLTWTGDQKAIAER